jgi:hypothetical protein
MKIILERKGLDEKLWISDLKWLIPQGQILASQGTCNVMKQ